MPADAIRRQRGVERDRKPRLLWLVTQFETGGAQRAIIDRVASLRATFEISVLVLTDLHGFLLDELRASGVHVRILGLEHLSGTWTRVAALREAMSTFAPDAVCGSLVWDHTYGAAAAVLANVPVLVADVQSTFANRQTYGRAVRWAEAAAFHLAFDRLIGCSEGSRMSYCQAWPWLRRRWTVIRNAVDVERLQTRQFDKIRPVRNRDVVIGALGRISTAKNHEFLIRAFARIAQRHPHARLRIAGPEGSRSSEVASAVQALGLQGRVQLEGEVRDPAAFLSELDVFVLPSAWEGLGLVVVEAMALGLPVIATSVGGVPELIQNGVDGWLVPSGDEARMAGVLDLLIADAAKRRKVGAIAREHARRFDVRYHCRDWRQSLTELIEDADERGHSDDVSPRRVLLFRTCPMSRAEAIVSDLNARWPEAAIDVVCGEADREVVRRFAPEAACHTFAGRAFSIHALGLRNLSRLRSRYDAVVIPYNDQQGRGYRQVEWAARVIAGPSVYGYGAWTDSVTWRGQMSVPRMVTPWDLARQIVRRRVRPASRVSALARLERENS